MFRALIIDDEKKARDGLKILLGKDRDIVIDGECNNGLDAIMMRFKTEWLDKSDYIRRDLFSIEEYLPENKRSDYPFFKRKIYVPLKHR